MRTLRLLLLVFAAACTSLDESHSNSMDGSASQDGTAPILGWDAGWDPFATGAGVGADGGVGGGSVPPGLYDGGFSQPGLGDTGAPDLMPRVGVDAGQGPAGGGGSEAGVTPADPCAGRAGCVACTADANCPEPGACLVKHCNTAQGICEPSFAPAQTACGTSKCDGAGHCVGCLSDNDCGDPGECKVRFCNQSTRVCEPKNAPSTTTCARGHCDSGACVQCSSASECADKTCNTKSCSSGQCVYTPQSVGAACTGGVCTSTQTCRECTTEAQCTRFNGLCTEGRCVNNVCQSWNKTGPCGTLKMCSSTGTCQDSCGNGTTDTQAGEQCDPMAPFMNDWMCNSQTCQSTGLSAGTSGTSYRRRCSSNSNCAANEMCVVSLQLGALFGETTPLCIPKCESGQCRRVPGYSLMQNNMSTACTEQAACAIGCTTASDCPPNVNCSSNLCGGPFY